MVNDSWQPKIDAYIDAELPAEEMRAMSAHLEECPSCAADALRRTELKRALRMAGRQYTPSVEFRQRVRAQITKGQERRPLWVWGAVLGTAAIAILLAFLAAVSWMRGAHREQLLAQVADLHVTDLAGSNPVEVASSDRHTVKPWFQGKLPFTFNLPEFQDTGFTLVGGRVAYFAQAPGAQLIVDRRKHHISVFIFQARPQLDQVFGRGEAWGRPAAFQVETWTSSGLRYFVVSDAGRDDIRQLSDLLRVASTQ